MSTTLWNASSYEHIKTYKGTEYSALGFLSVADNYPVFTGRYTVMPACVLRCVARYIDDAGITQEAVITDEESSNSIVMFNNFGLSKENINRYDRSTISICLQIEEQADRYSPKTYYDLFCIEYDYNPFYGCTSCTNPSKVYTTVDRLNRTFTVTWEGADSGMYNPLTGFILYQYKWPINSNSATSTNFLTQSSLIPAEYHYDKYNKIGSITLPIDIASAILLHKDFVNYGFGVQAIGRAEELGEYSPEFSVTLDENPVSFGDARYYIKVNNTSSNTNTFTEFIPLLKTSETSDNKYTPCDIYNLG